MAISRIRIVDEYRFAGSDTGFSTDAVLAVKVARMVV